MYLSGLMVKTPVPVCKTGDQRFKSQLRHNFPFNNYDTLHRQKKDGRNLMGAFVLLD